MNTFRRFGLEIQACNIRIRSVHKIGLDIEEAVLQGVASMFPDVHHLYCICHLMQRDEQKINCILQKLDCRENERLRPQKEILSDIYGERRRGLYEYGLEFSDAEEFSEKLASLERKWESRCPGFFKWFNEKRKKKFIDGVIVSLRTGALLTGLCYQNDVKSQHFVEKDNQCFQKSSVKEVIDSFQQLSERQENEEIRAIYSAGSYRLAITYNPFQVDSARWHSWNEETRKNHIKKMRSYTPIPSDAFNKPSNTGRKPGSIIRRRKEQPTEVLLDRIQNSQETLGNRENIHLHISKSPTINKWRSSPCETENSNNIRFPNPCNDQPKIFELYCLLLNCLFDCL